MLIVKLIGKDGSEKIREVVSIEVNAGNIPPTVTAKRHSGEVEEIFNISAYYVMNEDGKTVANWRDTHFV